MMVLVTTTMLNLKTYNIGIGPSHIINRLGHVIMYRWGVWTPWFTIFLSKILPVEQIPHNHEGNFFQFYYGEDTPKLYINMVYNTKDLAIGLIM